MRIETEEFILDLPGEWQQAPSEGPEQFIYESQTLSAAIVVSYIFAAIPAEKMLSAAQTALSSARDTLDQEGPHFVGENYVELFEGPPRTAHWKLAGQTQRNIFRQEGWVTEAKLFNFWAGVADDDQERATTILNDVFAGLNFYFP